ncbi:MAG: hypothetical protein K2Q15_14120 [Burkholderiales bacterium]|nr:hypothetical protein [Burkholderiales bacterium]
MGNRRFELRPLMHPDFHMVNFTFKEIGNPSLEDHNRLNQRMYEVCSYSSGRTYSNDFLTSSTSLAFDEYGDTPWMYAESRGFSRKEWDKTKSVYILRAAVMTHFLRDPQGFEDYWTNLRAIFAEKLGHIIDMEAKEANQLKAA